MDKNIKNKKIIITFTAILGVVLFVLLISKVSLQNDTLFDIKLGEQYVTEGINTVDNFSIHENLKYVSHHFMANIITYLVYDVCGFMGLYFLEILLTLIIALLFYNANRIFLKSNKMSYLLLFVELLFMSPYISVRAQMYSYILFLLEIICIEKFLRKKDFKMLILLSILPLLIINFHAGTIFFYFIMIGVYLLNYLPIKMGKFESNRKIKKNLKYLLIPVVSGILLMFLNPFGIDNVLYSVKTLNNTFINNNIAEFQPATLFNCLMGFIYIFALINSYILTKKKIRTEQVFLLYGTIFMTLLSFRHFSLLVIVSVTSIEHITSFLQEIKEKILLEVDKNKIKNMKMSMSFIYLFVIFSFGFFWCAPKSYDYLPEDTYPLEGMKYIDNNIAKDSKIFNEYAWGSLMMFHNRKVFIDSRADLYTKEYNKDVNVAMDYIDAINCNKDYNEILKKYNIDYLFISPKSSLYHNVENNVNYECVYKDEYSAIVKVNI
ncbi:MAG: hypothetical protein PHP54_02255 [Clostridia bacterium]|nr:hypothetical protein [Clostridia bacterium]